MTPLTVSIALIASDSNQSSNRSVTLIVNRRVTSATPRCPRPRIFHAVCACGIRSTSFVDPTCGGTLSSSGPEHVGHALHPRLPLGERVGILLRELRDRVIALLRVIGVDGDRTPVGERLEVGTERCHVVAVPLQLQLADDRRRHQRHHVGVGRDVDLRVVGERGARVGCASGLVSGLQHHGAGAVSREVGPAGEPVVATADDDGVVGVRRHRVDRPSPELVAPRLAPGGQGAISRVWPDFESPVNSASR